MLSLMLWIVGVAAGTVGTYFAVKGGRRGWGRGAAIGALAAGPLLTLLVPFGGLITLATGGAMWKLSEKRQSKRLASDIDRMFRKDKALAAALDEARKEDARKPSATEN